MLVSRPSAPQADEVGETTMLGMVLLLSIAGDDAPKGLSLRAAAAPATHREARCENARGQSIREGETPAPTLRSLDKEPPANRYRPVVRFVQCDTPVVIARGVDEPQR